MGLRVTMTGPLHSLVTQARGQFKDAKVHSKRALKGTLSGEIFIKLPLSSGVTAVRRLQGNGNLVARDGEQTNVDLINKVQRVTGLIGLSPSERREPWLTERTCGPPVPTTSRCFRKEPRFPGRGPRAGRAASSEVVYESPAGERRGVVM